ncbi:MAG: hypothetical protein AB7F09_02595 [Parvibaculaceae bacterium]
MPLVDLSALERLTQGEKPSKTMTRDPRRGRLNDVPAAMPEPGAMGKWTPALN